MIETSRDVLNIVIASCVGLFTLFICWMLWYIIRAMRQVNYLVDGVKEKIDLIDKILKSIKEKVDSTASYLPILAKGISQLIEYFKNRQDKKPKKTK